MLLLPLIVSFLFLVTALSSVAVERDLYFNNLSLEQGLNQGSIYSLARDPFGFTWIGTQDGLHRFDGNTIELVPLSATQLPKYRYIRDISIINEQLYVATTDGLVVINLFSGEKSYPDVRHGVIYSVVEVNKQVWLGSDIGLIILNSDHKLVDYYGSDSLVNRSFCQISSAPQRCRSEIRTLAFDQERQTVWLGTNTGLFEFNLEDQRVNTGKNLDDFIQYHQVDSKHLAGNTIRKLFIDSEQKLWIASYYGVHFLSLASYPEQREFKHAYHQKNKPDTLSSNRVLAISQDNQGNIWLGTSNGLSRHKNTSANINVDFSRGWQNFHAHNASAHSLADNNIRSLLTDSEGRMWVGTNKGVSVTNIQRDKVAIYRTAKTNAYNNYILSFTEESQDKYWIGTKKGLFIFDHEIAYAIAELQGVAVYDTLIISNSIWAATRHGIYQINITDHKVTRHYHGKDSPVDDSFIYKLIYLEQSLWLATTNGLHQINLVNNQWQSWYEKEGLVDDEIYTLYEHQNKLWIGTAKGLSIFDVNSQTFNNYSPHNSALQSPWIFNIHHLHDDRFLIASDGGVYEFNSTEESFDYLGITHGNAYGLIPDEQGDFWITSNHGLYRYHTSSRKFTQFVEQHGFASNEYNLNASLKNSQGELLLGTINGFVIFKPATLEHTEAPLKDRLVSSVQIEHQRYSLWDSLALTNDTAIFLAKDFNLDWHDEKIELQLSNPYFALAAPVQSHDFITNINLSNIQSGSYPMPLSLNPNNTIQVTKQSHPLLSWWAIVAYIIIFSSLLMFFTRYRLMGKFNDEILRNHDIIASQKDKIEQHMLFKQSLYLQIQHSFKSPVFACRGLSKQIATLLSSPTDIDKVSLERKNNKLFIALNEISVLIDEFIVLTQQQPVVNVSSKQYVLATLAKVNALMSDVAIDKNIAVEFSCEASLTEYDHIIAAEKCLFLILENVLSNAIKFSHDNGRVQVISSKVAGSLVIAISDHGCGFSNNDLSNIFTLYYRGENSQHYSGSGVGLTTTKQLIDEINGTINFEKNTPYGTIVTITIPLK